MSSSLTAGNAHAGDPGQLEELLNVLTAAAQKHPEWLDGGAPESTHPVPEAEHAHVLATGLLYASLSSSLSLSVVLASYAGVDI